MKARNADKGLVLREHPLSSKKCRLCICTYHKARGIFDVWRKWILKRPVDILTKSFLFLKKHLGLLLPAAPSHQRENIPQCPGQWQQFSSPTDYINILYSSGKISTVPESSLLFTTPKWTLIHKRIWSVVQSLKSTVKSTPVMFAVFFKSYSYKYLRCSLKSSGDLISMLQ